MTSRKYSFEDKHRAASALVATCNSVAASRECSIPSSTLRHWRAHDEQFQLILQELMAEVGETMKFKYAQIIEESADQVLDRLRSGDFVREKTGELTRVPLKGRDLALVNAISFDKLRLAESKPTTIVGKSDDVTALAKQFADLSKKWQEKQSRVVAVVKESEEPD